jgi:hypothetical protein
MNQASTMTALAAVVVSCGLGFAQQPPSTNPTADKTVTHGTTKDGVPKALVEGSAPDVSGAPVPETAGQARNFEDRWSGRDTGASQPPQASSLPSTPAASSERIGESPTVSRKMGPEMESSGDVRVAPDSE